MIKIRQFSAEWCTPCRMWKRALSMHPKVELEYISLDEKRTDDSWKSIREKALQYDIEDIRGVPFFMIEKEGEWVNINQMELQNILNLQ